MIGLSLRDRQEFTKTNARHEGYDLTEELLWQVVVLLCPGPSPRLPSLSPLCVVWLKHWCGLMGTRWTRSRTV